MRTSVPISELARGRVDIYCTYIRYAHLLLIDDFKAVRPLTAKGKKGDEEYSVLEKDSTNVTLGVL